MTIEEAALILNEILKSAYSDPHQALNKLSNTMTPVEISHLRDATITHIATLCKPARKPRSK